jgi:outer membrane lipoprotein-sorting protein
MIGLLGLILAVQTAQDATIERDPGVVISKVFLKYYNAKSLSGTIVQETTDGKGVVKITTRVNYERPSKVSILQDYKGGNGLMLSLVGDGVKFAYDPPRTARIPAKPRERLIELVRIDRTGTNVSFIHGVGEMYHAAHVSLMPSTLLDLAVAYKEHLNDFKINVRTIALQGLVDVGGQKAYYITGQWQPYHGSAQTGTYEIWVSLDFDLLRFRLVEQYSDGRTSVKATTTETANLKVNVPVDQTLFVVR